MKPSLQLKFSQQLTMTPQLQQAIKLLQLSTMDLQTEIQEALDSNPLLEVEEHVNDSGDQSLETNHSVESKENSNEQVEVSADSVESGDALQNNDIPEDLPLDSTWDEYLSASSAPSSPSNPATRATAFTKTRTCFSSPESGLTIVRSGSSARPPTEATSANARWPSPGNSTSRCPGICTSRSLLPLRELPPQLCARRMNRELVER